MKPAQVLITAALGAALASPFQDLLGSPNVEVRILDAPQITTLERRDLFRTEGERVQFRSTITAQSPWTYTVPAGNRLFITKIWIGQISANGYLRIDGEPFLIATDSYGPQTFEDGYAVEAGQIVSSDKGLFGMIGFLVDA